MMSHKYCMEFSNSDIVEYLVKPLRSNPLLDIRLWSASDVEIDEYSEEEIKSVHFYGDKENFYVYFWGHLTSIFISDDDVVARRKNPRDIHFTFNMDFMFMDDYEKQFRTSSDTHGNILYEGTLLDKTHEEILVLLREFVELLIGSKYIEYEEIEVAPEGGRPPICNYVVTVTNDSREKSEIIFENITFRIGAR